MRSRMTNWLKFLSTVQACVVGLSIGVQAADFGFVVEKAGRKVSGQVTFGFNVVSVASGSVAESAGLQSGDFIVDWFFPTVDRWNPEEPQLARTEVSFSRFVETLAAVSDKDCVRLSVMKAALVSETSSNSSGAEGSSAQELLQVDISGDGPVSGGCLKKAAPDVDRERDERIAELAAMNDAIFNDSFPGLVLRAITVGKFELVPQIEAEMVGDIVGASAELFGVDRNDPFVRIFGEVMKLSNVVDRQSGILTAYALGRTQYLGACGDPLTHYSQDTVYWTDYVNAFGQTLSSSPETRSTAYAEVPSKFDAIIKAQNDIDSSFLLAQAMAAIVSRLSCDSPARLQLEDNMIAYFNGSRPIHIAPVPDR